MLRAPLSRVRGDWADHLGEMRGAVWQTPEATRVRIGFRHPMDTGLVENIPAYNIDELTLTRAGGAALARMVVHGSVSEDPAFTLMLAPGTAGPVVVRARDSGGFEFVGTLAADSGTRIAAARGR